MNADVLITGATGLIGGEIAWRLTQAGRRVWCVVRSRSFAEAAARMEHRFALSGQACNWSRLVALPGDVTRAALGLAPNTIGHLRRQCRHVIHCAADTSFAAGIIREDDVPAGFSNDHVLSKRNCEALVLESSVDSVVLRPSIVLSRGVHSPEFARSTTMTPRCGSWTCGDRPAPPPPRWTPNARAPSPPTCWPTWTRTRWRSTSPAGNTPARTWRTCYVSGPPNAGPPSK